jgi:hypothetical protein
VLSGLVQLNVGIYILHVYHVQHECHVLIRYASSWNILPNQPSIETYAPHNFSASGNHMADPCVCHACVGLSVILPNQDLLNVD